MVVIDKETCIGCGKCVADCPANYLELRSGKAECATGRCILCGHCVAICPTRSPSITDYDMSEVEELPTKHREQTSVLMDVLKSRRTIRQFQSKKVEQDKMELLVQAGRYTATAANKQTCKYIFVQDGLDDFKKSVWAGLEQFVASGAKQAAALAHIVERKVQYGKDPLFRDAPAVLYIAAENAVDAGLAAQNMELVALSLGLGFQYSGYLVHATPLGKEAYAMLQLEDKPLQACMLLGTPQVEYLRTVPRKKADVVFL